MIRLQLDRDALEYILGKDAEADIRLKNSIVEDVMRRHIKSVCNEDSYKAILDKIKKEIQEEAVKYIFDSFKQDFSGSISNVKLSDKHLSAIGMIVDREFNDKVETSINAALDKIQPKLDAYITEKINYYISYCVKKKLSPSMEEVLDKFVEKLKIEEKDDV